MTTLKIVTKTTHYVDAYDLCEYLADKIGITVEYGETSNDTDYSIILEKEELDDWDHEYVSKFFKTGYINFDSGWRQVLTHCVNEGWIEEGNYVISVSW